ncbi:MAG: DUF1028 domain-containing protein [Immundisolibacterales bacterium]|nr:DUF1028 domain-containing protein [Immundisolibacterales bacterium]
MTFTAIGACPESGRLGVGIATYSIGVGGYCPFVERGVAALSTQAFANPALGPEAMTVLRTNADPERTLAGLAESDTGFAWRQVVIASADGRIAAHTGAHTRPWSGHVTGDGFAVFGNVLAGEETVRAMAETWRNRGGDDLPERLLAALEAGRDAGGQAAADGSHLAERSSALIVRGPDIVEDFDLRVDLHDDAVGELRRLYERYRTYLPYYALRARAPSQTPPQDAWARENDPADRAPKG